ncbi:DJ-1/PfpI family protein [Enterobacter roggenkampii]|uniref:DJ-1/PfpI family protein n=1 Tax=Enterobacter roggenkampii TaxID=1812935 RepID=UPI001F05CE3A|nr:DJ-1/PfpI family protein [Enterobacter roggenkampii]
MMTIAVLLFDEFETLDAMGPVEILGMVPDFRLRFISQSGGKIRSSQNVIVSTELAEGLHFDTLLIPGGEGTRMLSMNVDFLHWLEQLVAKSRLCLTVCTGSALLACTPMLNGRHATSNKLAFEWVRSRNQQVFWQPNARWVKDGTFYTSSGVSAGMDMALQVVSDLCGQTQALEIARKIEYVWNDDPGNDPFSNEEPL